MPSTLQYARVDLKSYDPNAPDPIWELVKRYRKICGEKMALQEEILRELDEREHGADLEVENARMALVAIRHGTRATDRRGSSTRAWGNHGQGERPAITDLDGPREYSIQNSDGASRRVSPHRLAEDTSNLLPYARMAAAAPVSLPSPISRTSITPATLIPSEGPSSVPADGSVFAKYNEMIAALRTRSPPTILSFIPQEEIPWPLLPSDGVFPVTVSRKRQIELDGVAEFAAGYALWRDKPLRQTIHILLGHWIAMHKRLKETSMHAGQGALGVTPEASETLRWIANVRSKLYAIAAEQDQSSDPSVFTTYERLMTLLAQDKYQVQAIPWPILPGLGEQYPAPSSGGAIKPRQIGRFVQAYSIWKSCSKADIYARMLSEWEELHRSFPPSEARTKQCIKKVVNYLAEYA